MELAAQIFQRHVFVDLETTGLDPATDEVIEVGALFVERGVAVRRVSRLFRASAPLSTTIQRLTGISDADLAGAPPFGAFVPELKELLQGWTVVAHNAAFEQSFLAELLAQISAPVLDSCELLHFLYPELDSHSLESLIRWAQVGERAQHRALKDCEDTFAVLDFALRRACTAERTEELADLLDCLDERRRSSTLAVFGEAPSPVVNVLDALLEESRRHAQPLKLEHSSRFLPGRPQRHRQVPPPQRPSDPDAPVKPLSASAVATVLGQGGALALAEDGFTPREAQVRIGAEVAGTLSAGGKLAIEAGTGTGKSLAYLAPVALFAAQNGRRVGVAPHTKTLQDQLIDKDLPRLHRATGGAFEYAVLKGQSNYLCRRRLLEVTRVEREMGPSDRAARAYLRAFARRSAEGDLDKLSHWFKGRYPALVPLSLAVRSEAQTTLGERCPHFRKCFYHSAVAQAEAADVVVINQALAVAWPNRYPKLDALVLDEAHELEDVLTTALSAESSFGSLSRLIERLAGRANRRGVMAELTRALISEGKLAAAKPLVLEMEAKLLRLGGHGQKVGDALGALLAAHDRERDRSELRITPAIRQGPAWRNAAEAISALKSELEELQKALGPSLREVFPELSGQLALERELAGATTAAQELTLHLGTVVDGPQATRCDFLVANDNRDWCVTSAPLDVSTFFSEDLARKARALILSSATLSTGGKDNPWVLERLGLYRGEAPVKLHRAPSPFRLREQCLVVLVTDAPEPQDPAFLPWSAERIAGFAQFLGGRTLGLFASSRRLEEVGERVRALLEPMGIEVLRQSRGNARALAARQERDHGSVLLGTKSFWQGVDIPGLGVACVFIDKLPIEPHTRPIVAAREETFAPGAGSGNFAGFNQYRLPRALIQLRQGVGRLVRSPQDRGVVVIADPGSARYREKVRAALEGYRVEELPWAKARLRLHETMLQMGLAVPRRRPEATAQLTSGLA